MSVPRDVTIAVVEGELVYADTYASRHGWRLTWLKDGLILLADGKHPADQSSLRWRAELAGYRAIPPAWTCFRQEGKDAFKSRLPSAGSLPGGGSSIFHSSGVICAPFNRLAYQEHSGPHSDWGGPANWMKVHGFVTATVLAEMLAQLVVHLQYSPGWQ